MDEKFNENIISHYANLYFGYRWAEENRDDKDVEVFENNDDLLIYLPKGLPDEDKLICVAFMKENWDAAVTTKDLSTLFGWTKYHSKKIRKSLTYINTISLVYEDGGYAGKGWSLKYGVMNEIKNFQSRHRKNCVECAKTIRDDFYNINRFICPVTDSYIFSVYDYCIYKKLESKTFNTDLWKRTY